MEKDIPDGNPPFCCSCGHNHWPSEPCQPFIPIPMEIGKPDMRIENIIAAIDKLTEQVRRVADATELILLVNQYDKPYSSPMVASAVQMFFEQRLSQNTKPGGEENESQSKD